MKLLSWGDGNHIDKTENNYSYYRKMVYEYTKNNKEILKYFFYRLDNENEYNIRYDIQNGKTFSTDFEISAVAVVLKRGIIIYNKETN